MGVAEYGKKKAVDVEGSSQTFYICWKGWSFEGFCRNRCDWSSLLQHQSRVYTEEELNMIGEALCGIG